MTVTERDKWESNAIGLAGGGIGASLMIWLGAGPWLAATFYLLLAVGVTVWANWRSRRVPESEEPRQ